MSDFKQPNFHGEIIGETQFIPDGLEKINVAIAGFKDPKISEKFPISSEALRVKQEQFGDELYGCIHIRRGDYLNVASYLINDESFLSLAKRVSSFLKNLLIVSDTPLSFNMENGLSKLDTKITVSIGGDPHLTHGLMRLSDILICSNSQFSMSAAFLRGEDKLTICPSQHDGDLKSYSNLFLERIREFQVISNYKL